MGAGGWGGVFPPLTFTSCKQSQFCFKEMILFPRSLLNDAFKGLFFFNSFHLKHFFFFFLPWRGKKERRES